MNPLWFLLAFLIGKNMRSDCEEETKAERSFSSDRSADGYNTILAGFYGFLVAWLAVCSTMMSAPFDLSQSGAANALAAFMPAIEVVAATLIYYAFLTEASSRTVMFALALSATMLTVIWSFWLTGDLVLFDFWERQGLAVLPAFSMVATTYLLHRFSERKE